MAKEILFLTLAEVVEIHNDQIENYGGSFGVRDMGLLESAVAQPSGTFSGQWLHENLYMMAAAYAFHICENHPFFDGNKRVALASALVFLELNDIMIFDAKGNLYDAVMQMAQGKMKKGQFAELLEKLTE